MNLQDTIKKYPLLAKQIHSVSSAQAAYRMLKSTESKEQYFQAINVLSTQFGGYYDSFERKFISWFEIDLKTNDITIPEINSEGFISERSLVKKKGFSYIKLHYSATPAMALEEFLTLNK